MPNQGLCYLVGAGPGDPSLITLKGKQAIETCDVLVYDALSSPEFLSWTKSDCEKIYAGKRAADHAIPQEGINALIVEKSLEGKIVCRLKGGDPMIFGRGGEEAAELAEAGVPFEIVPGISSTIGGPAYAGIPVTHRAHNTQLTIFTGHEDPTKEETSFDYAQLAQAPGTKVFVMGVARLREITTQLTENGADPKTPIALTRWATTGQHRTITGTLADIADIAEQQNFKSPAVAVIGTVVNERQHLNWFETKPLFGKRIVVTRTREQAGKLSSQLKHLGAEVLERPTIRIEHPDDKVGFAELVRDAHRYDWLVFTSPNGVEKFFQGFYAIYDDARSLGGPKIAAIGPATVAKIKEYRFTVDLVPDKHVAEGLLEAFKSKDVDSQTILWVKAEETRMIIADGLNQMKAIVDICVAYKTIPEAEDPTGARALLEKEGADYITFTSGSTAEHFFNLHIKLPDHCQLASIGPVTSKTLTKLGHPPHLEAQTHDIPGLVQAIQDSISA
ncbi:MAG: uroporphyrinogen-III C-methyltransferase [Verrucomicrobiota bacterium]